MPARWKFCKPQDASVAETSPSPLAGKRIVVTRPLAQCIALCDALRAYGAEPLALPLIRIVAVGGFAELDAGLKKLRARDWIILTSQNAVDPVASRLRLLRAAEPDTARDVHIAVVGPATQQAAKEASLGAHYVAQVHDGVSLAHELGERLRGRRVLLPRSDLASTEMPAAIRQYGAEVTEVIAYRTEYVRESEAELQTLIATRRVDAIVCFSPSAVHSLVNILGTSVVELHDRIRFVAIGEVTARAFREAGVREPLVAADATTEAAVGVLSDHFARQVQRDFAGAKKA
jgi:uroporphyrinogen-III synthase